VSLKAKIAVVGVGSIGSRHLRVLMQSGVVTVCAVSARESARTALVEEGVPAFANVSEAADWGASMAIVATDTRRHLRDGIETMDRGMDLLIEKPMAVDAKEAVQLRRKALELDRALHVGCTFRFSEGLEQFRNLLSQVGSLHFVRIECLSYLPDWKPSREYRDTYSARLKDGGVLRDLIHEVDYAGWLYGWPEAVQANVRNYGRLDIEADEAADLQWETKFGARVSISVDYLTAPPVRWMRAFGENGTVMWDGIGGSVHLALNGQKKQIMNSAQTRDEMLLNQDLAFVRSCKGETEDRLASAEDGVRALTVCDVARRSSDNKRLTEVDYI